MPSGLGVDLREFLLTVSSLARAWGLAADNILLDGKQQALRSC